MSLLQREVREVFQVMAHLHVDAILDKIRKSGYDSLTKEEKKRLFDASNQS